MRTVLTVVSTASPSAVPSSFAATAGLPSFQACQMTIDPMDYDADDFYDGVTTGVGAATAIQDTADADIQLLI